MDRDLKILETVLEHLLQHQTIVVNVGANASDFHSAIAMEEFMEIAKVPTMVPSGVMFKATSDTVTVRALTNVDQLSSPVKHGHTMLAQLLLCIIVTVDIVRVDEVTPLVALEIMQDHAAQQLATRIEKQKELI